MNKKQWFACAVIFFIFGSISGAWSGFYGNLALIGTGELSNVDLVSFLIARMYSVITLIFWAGFLICLACGYLQKTPAQEWVEVELAKMHVKKLVKGGKKK